MSRGTSWNSPRPCCICTGVGFSTEPGAANWICKMHQDETLNEQAHHMTLEPEKPALRDYTSAERKATPVHAGCLLYFPDAIAAVARLSKKGNDKHNPNEPLHWSRSKSNDHAECVARHSLTPDAIDLEMQESHRTMIAWRALADLQIAEEKRLVAAGIKPLSGVVE